MAESTQIVTSKRAVPELFRKGWDAVLKLTREESQRLAKSLMCDTVENVRRLAQLVFRFEQEGWDSSELVNSQLHYVRLIAHGQLLPEAYVAVADPALLDVITRLAIPDQERVARNEEVQVLTGFNEEGKPLTPYMGLGCIAPKVARTVLRGGKINSIEEQIATERVKLGKKLAKMKDAKITPDKRNGGFIVACGPIRLFVSAARVEAAVSAYRK